MTPILAITMGDPAGIGPEICVRSLARKETYALCKPIIIGDAKIIQLAVDLLKLDLPLSVNAVKDVKDAKFELGTIDVYDLDLIDLATFKFGEVQVQCGNAAFQYVRKAIELAMADDVDGTCTAPLNKEAIHLAGHNYDGHTEIYATFTNTKKYAMLLADGPMRVIHVSTHVSLREACDRCKKDRIMEVYELIDDACRQFGIDNPHIAISGLNPHCSENGLFGWEEAKEIIPAVEELKARGFNVEGPVPPDSVFAKAKSGKYDGVVAQYHDQGHIPLKVVGFNWDAETGKMLPQKGVNITLGLPIIRVSVDHGTAFDVAGKGVAAEDALISSIEYAAKMAITRRQRMK
ncbi:MAG: 4-hydroxythreonine-4-phosphate dehydrogenase PdxA [Bacteroidales bacterium]|nr:4-hydroxythreonine-4-phosphate dehydrogenase PdxA [Bacteroidales bacterium]MCM1146788.1 4-hydroxythreonine-4-phosphate dehydrogenase PdxA [Bacteroidales bacterium]MCM1205715.1 4-hydroxythreonine-4-phosphate dehydrogenase PdxA [Bacillota bacterium]MCM1510755.1 4-hydroxythreonine-4-phosphate dehydrogenase PdxA [Clostridium sp.]